MDKEKVRVFEASRPKLINLAYRLLGSYSDAEDAVQDGFLRWHQYDGEKLDSPEAWLCSVTTNLCLDRLKKRRYASEEYRGQWLPEPIATSTPDEAMELADSVSFALLTVLEQLKPRERAAYLLHDVFDYDYAFIGTVLKTKEASCRQVVKRARDRIKAARPRFDAPREQQIRLRDGFMEACQSGELEGFVALLEEDIVLESDGGRSVKSALNPIHGINNVTRFLAGILHKSPPGTRLEPCEINGAAGFVTYVGDHLFSATTFGYGENGICRLYVVLNQEKLGQIHRALNP